MINSIGTIDIDLLELITGGADDGGAPAPQTQPDLCSQAMVSHLTGGTPSPEGVAACAKQGITFGFSSPKDLPQLPKSK
jgi:hypothetical protein